MSNHTSLFIDESGSPSFYAKRKRPLWIEPDFEPVLMLGMTVVRDRRALREKVLDFQKAILADPFFNTISSTSRSDWFLHASKDHSDVRLKCFEFIRGLDDLQCFVVIGRKLPDIFHQKHNGKEAEFYFDMLSKLLARYDFQPETDYSVYLSQRQSNTLDRFETALKKSLDSKSNLLDMKRFMCRITPSSEFPELSIIDYLLWAVRRAISKGEEETRFLNALQGKFTEIVDVYGNDGKGAIYDAANPFNLAKTGPFGFK